MDFVSTHWTLMLASALLVAISLTIFRRQAQAVSCPRHSRIAGRVAVVIGWLSLAAAVGLFGYALLL